MQKKQSLLVLFRQIIASTLIFALLAPQLALGASFNRHNILSDQELEDFDSFSLTSIKRFLKRKGGILGTYQTPDLDGVFKSAGEIIFNVSQLYRLNPKFFIVLFQKESGVVTDGSVNPAFLEDYPLGFGICDSCSKTDPEIIDKYKGFTKQTYAAGERIRNGYLSDLDENGHTISGWGPGITKTTLDGLTITPKNDATSVLYTYNPWVGAYGGGDPRWGANSLFWKLWNEWFTTLYPDGSLLREMGGNGGIFLIEDGLKRPFTSAATFFANYSLDQVIDVPRNVLDAYERGSELKFPQYALLKGPDATYLLVDGKKRRIKNYATFRKIGFNPEEVLEATPVELEAIPDGNIVSEESIYPKGALLQYDNTGAIVYVDPEGLRHDLASPEILNSNYPYLGVIRQHPDDIDVFPKGNAVLFPDGSLITSSKHRAIYLISKGERRAFSSKDVFESLGYKWTNVIETNAKSVDLHPLGKPIRE